ncbi:MAG: hydantoinase/oxoprolinase family protein, partial [Candidatus Hermodarchaeota archaeon]
GTVWSKEAIRRPHTLIESGPAAGLIASGHLAKILGVERCIGFDMGGTTAKAGLILNGEIQYAAEYEVGAELHHGGRVKGSGYPLRFPMVDVAECGAGAGSIAWIDSGGHLKVGPSSAGANPGPACYGKGGKEPTVTDAHLVLGHLSPDYFLGGEMQLEPKLAENAINKYIAEPMDITLEKAAQGIITIANANMLRVLRLVSVARGHDPRDFTLMAYGGAGPLHAIALAEEMFIGQVIIPQLSGLFSALGLLYADMSTDFVETVMLTLTPENLDSLNAVLANLNEKAEKFFERAEVPSKARLSRVSADLRYLRQNYELKVPLEASQISSCDLSFIRTRFNKYHENTYGYKSLDEPIQVVNLRLFALRRLIKPKPHRIGSSIDPVDIALHKTQIVWFSDGPQRCDVYRRDKLQKGHHIEGPAIIQEKEATTVVEVGWHVQVDEFGNLIMKRHP